MKLALLLAAAGSLAAAPASAQSLADRIAVVRDGVVRLSFAARPNVCGDGSGGTWIRSPRFRNSGGDQYRACVNGPVRVSLGRSENQTVSVRTLVGGKWGAPTSEIDLGDVSPNEAARYLTRLARFLGGQSGDEALSAAAFADNFDLAPEFTSLVRDENVRLQSRKQALFWLGQSDMPTSDLVGLYEHLTPFELREHFTFVLAQRHDDAALDKLLDVAQHDRDVEIRKRAMFWLGQSKDPKVVKFFRTVLTP